MNGKVGLLIPFYKNSTEYTSDLFKSITKQTYDNTKTYSLIDGDFENHSTYNTVMAFDKNVISLPYNLGTFRAYNILGYFAYADKCDYVIPIGQDDILEPKFIETGVQLLERGNYDCVNYPVQAFGQETCVMGPRRDATYKSAWEQNPFTSFMLFKMEVWKELNGYDVSITPNDIKVGIEDCELNLRLLRDQYKIGFVDEILYKYRVHQAQAHRIAKPHLPELYKIIKEKHERN